MCNLNYIFTHPASRNISCASRLFDELRSPLCEINKVSARSPLSHLFPLPSPLQMHCALLRNHVIFAHVNNCHLAASTKYAQISESTESTESTESSESSESGEPSDSMFPSIPCAAPLCIMHYALCIFQGEATPPPPRAAQ